MSAVILPTPSWADFTAYGAPPPTKSDALALNLPAAEVTIGLVRKRVVTMPAATPIDVGGSTNNVAPTVVTEFKHNSLPPKQMTATSSQAKTFVEVQASEFALAGLERQSNRIGNIHAPETQPKALQAAAPTGQLPPKNYQPAPKPDLAVVSSPPAIPISEAPVDGFQPNSVQVAFLPPVPTAGMEVHFTRTDPAIGSFHVKPHQADNTPPAPAPLPMTEASAPALPAAGFDMPAPSSKPENDAVAANEATAWAAQLQILERENQALRNKLQLNETDRLSDIKVDAVAKIHEEVLRDRVAQLEKELDRLSMQKDRALPQKTATPPTPAQITPLLAMPPASDKK